MTREEFIEKNKGVYVVETSKYLSNPGIYAILISEEQIIAYKNPEIYERVNSATIWSQSCRTKNEAYEAINSYINALKATKKKLLKK